MPLGRSSALSKIIFNVVHSNVGLIHIFKKKVKLIF